MADKNSGSENIDAAISLRLLEMLLRNGVINRPTYNKVVKCYKRKEVA